MKQTIISILIFITASFVLNTLMVSFVEAESQSYKVYLFFDSSTQELRIDRFVDNPIQLVSQRDTLSYDDRVALPEEGRFVVQLSSNDYIFSDTLKYDLKPGEFQILVPYYPHVQAIRVALSESDQGTVIPVAEFSQCNQNSICELDQGENAITCLSDCTGESVQFSESTQQSLRENQGRIQTEDGTILLEATQDTPEQEGGTAQSQRSESNYLYLLGGIVLIAGALGGWVIVHFRK